MTGLSGMTVKAILTDPVLEGATIHLPLMEVVTALENLKKMTTVMNATTTMEGVNRIAPITMDPTSANAIQITNLLWIG